MSEAANPSEILHNKMTEISERLKSLMKDSAPKNIDSLDVYLIRQTCQEQINKIKGLMQWGNNKNDAGLKDMLAFYEEIVASFPENSEVNPKASVRGKLGPILDRYRV